MARDYGGMLLSKEVLTKILKIKSDTFLRGRPSVEPSGLAFCEDEQNPDSVDIRVKLVYNIGGVLKAYIVDPNEYFKDRRSLSFNDGQERTDLNYCKFEHWIEKNRPYFINNTKVKFKFSYFTKNQILELLSMTQKDLLLAGIVNNYGTGMGVIGLHFTFKLEPFPAIKPSEVTFSENEVLGIPTFVMGLPCPPGWKPTPNTAKSEAASYSASVANGMGRNVAVPSYDNSGYLTSRFYGNLYKAVIKSDEFDLENINMESEIKSSVVN